MNPDSDTRQRLVGYMTERGVRKPHTASAEWSRLNAADRSTFNAWAIGVVVFYSLIAAFFVSLFWYTTDSSTRPSTIAISSAPRAGNDR